MPSILKSFDVPIPDLNASYFEDNDMQKRTHMSGSGTDSAYAPSCWAEVPFENWNEDANKVLKRISKDDKAVLDKAQLPEVEPGIYLQNEGDVVRCSTLYLTHPVHMALGASYNAKFVFSA